MKATEFKMWCGELSQRVISAHLQIKTRVSSLGLSSAMASLLISSVSGCVERAVEELKAAKPGPGVRLLRGRLVQAGEAGLCGSDIEVLVGELDSILNAASSSRNPVDNMFPPASEEKAFAHAFLRYRDDTGLALARLRSSEDAFPEYMAEAMLTHAEAVWAAVMELEEAFAKAGGSTELVRAVGERARDS